MTRSVCRPGLVASLLLSLIAPVQAEPSPRVELGVNALQVEDTTRTPGFVFGGSAALARWRPFSWLALEPHLGALLVRRHAGRGQSGDLAAASYTLDSVEFPLLLRGELRLGGRALHVLGGVHGSGLLRVQQTDRAGVRRQADPASTLDLGLVAGAGLELGSFGGGQLALEMRYQRGERPVLPDTDSRPRSLSLLLGYRLDPDAGLAATGDDPSSSPLIAATPDQTRSLALKTAVIATRLSSSVAKSAFAPARRPGFSLGAALVPVRFGSRVALAPQLELAVTHHRTDSPPGHSLDAPSSPRAPGAGSLALDTLDTAAAMRVEVGVAGQRVFALAGLHGSVRLGARQLHDDLVIDANQVIPALDGGWLAGAGIELAATSRARLALEVRYQRSLRQPTAPGDLARESLAGMIGLTYHGAQRSTSGTPSGPGAATSGSPGTRVAGTVLIGRLGDRWLRHHQFIRLERATRDGVFGYRVTYKIPGHGKLALFWPRERIDLADVGTDFRLLTRKLKQGRLRYPDRITRHSLPRVHQGILMIERFYAAEADGFITAMEGFLAVVGLASVNPSARATAPRGPATSRPRLPRAKARQVKGKRGKGKSRGSQSSAGSAATGGTAAANGQLHHAISKKIYQALEDHVKLAGHYEARDPRFVTRGVDSAAHRGYQRWHRDLDREVVRWVREHDTATPAQFEAYLRSLYNRPELRARFPDGL